MRWGRGHRKGQECWAELRLKTLRRGKIISLFCFLKSDNLFTSRLQRNSSSLCAVKLLSTNEMNRSNINSKEQRLQRSELNSRLCGGCSPSCAMVQINSIPLRHSNHDTNNDSNGKAQRWTSTSWHSYRFGNWLAQAIIYEWYRMKMKRAQTQSGGQKWFKTQHFGVKYTQPKVENNVCDHSWLWSVSHEYLGACSSPNSCAMHNFTIMYWSSKI